MKWISTLLAFLPSMAAAANWHYFGRTANDDVLFYDSYGIQTDGNGNLLVSWKGSLRTQIDRFATDKEITEIVIKDLATGYMPLYFSSYPEEVRLMSMDKAKDSAWGAWFDITTAEAVINNRSIPIRLVGLRDINCKEHKERPIQLEERIVDGRKITRRLDRPTSWKYIPPVGNLHELSLLVCR